VANSFLNTLNSEKTENVPIYCTGYPESGFMEKYRKQFDLKISKKEILLNGKDFSLIKKMGFDAISLWDYRRGKGGYTLKNLNNNLRVDGWGRIFKGEWYTWNGVFTSKKILNNWEHLTLPSKKNLKELEDFLKKNEDELNFVLSLPGLFEKTWQSMGFKFFSKCLKNNHDFIFFVINFFQEYTKILVNALKNAGARIFLFADDLGYRNRTFIPKPTWNHFFKQPYEQIVKDIKKDNFNVILHSDGYITNMVDTFIEIGFDAIQGLEPNAGVDIFQLLKKYRNEICFIGNLDVSTHLTFGRKDDVLTYVRKLKNIAEKYNSPLIISPTQQIHTKVKPENLKAMIETTRGD